MHVSQPKLWRLTLNNTKVSDLTPLKTATSLRYLYISGTDVTDISPLQGLALREITLDLSKVKNWHKVLWEMKTLRYINDMSADKFWRTTGVPD